MMTPAERNTLRKTAMVSWAQLASQCASTRGKVQSVMRGEERSVFVEKRIAVVFDLTVDEMFGPASEPVNVTTPTRWDHMKEENDHEHR